MHRCHIRSQSLVCCSRCCRYGIVSSSHTCPLSEPHVIKFQSMALSFKTSLVCCFTYCKLSANFINSCFCTSFDNHFMWSWSNIVANFCLIDQQKQRRLISQIASPLNFLMNPKSV
ncbi:hypothetical protein BT93_L4552 [Corymbia citriodora subsp. variegata]|uniref:Uncharacterized protein n=1 Tax=Corymbia citriodora subsp. variegata TaxID=360336 RepID=A0A8T0CU39_CORYI|nr:hypothetical protein BT93_L4552 [Corymbia citriodora subsp. variegata]